MSPRTPESIAREAESAILHCSIRGSGFYARIILTAAREIAALEVAKSGAVEALRRCEKIVTYLIESGACNGQITTARNKAHAALAALRTINPPSP